jgi:hypothetical protein
MAQGNPQPRRRTQGTGCRGDERKKRIHRKPALRVLVRRDMEPLRENPPQDPPSVTDDVIH